MRRQKPWGGGCRPFLAALFAAWTLFIAPAGRAGPLRAPVAVARVVDGDTVVVRRGGRQERVRLLGIDTPERGRDGRPDEPFALAATRFVRERLSRAHEVELEVAGDRVDEHGRTLGFLWLRLRGSREPVNLSAEVLRAGLARAIRRFDYPGKADFAGLEREARRRGLGMWAGR